MCVAILPVTSLSQWNISYNTGNFSSSAIAVTNADTAMLVGNEYGRIYRTDDGGQSWTSYQTQFTSSWFFDLDFINESVGYAAGGTFFGTHTDLLARTTDGGVTWDSITSNNGLFGYTIDHIDFVNMDTGFVAGHSGLQKTMNGGTSFSPIPHPFNSISEVYFDNNNTGFVAESKALNNNYTGYQIWKTLDLGDSWNLVYEDSVQNATALDHRLIYRIQMVDANTGYASGGGSTILKTTDGGDSWVRNNIAPYSTLLTGMWFTDVNTGYINNAGGIYKTTDGGQNWVVQTVSPVGAINHIAFGDDQHGFAGGQIGIYKTDNGGIQTNVEQLDESNVQIFPNPVQDILNVRYDSEQALQVTVIDLKGRIQISDKQTREIDVSKLAPGSYVVRLTSNNQVVSKPFIKF